jgi:hypothetical protein
MITPEEKLRIEQARIAKSREIASFAEARTEQIIKTSAFNGAVDLVSAGFQVSDDTLELVKKMADKLETELRLRVLGTPF